MAIKKTPTFSIAEFSTWPMLHEFIAYRPVASGAEAPVQPDGFIRIHETEVGGKFEHTFFLELDRSSENQDKLIGNWWRWIYSWAMRFAFCLTILPRECDY